MACQKFSKCNMPCSKYPICQHEQNYLGESRRSLSSSCVRNLPGVDQLSHFALMQALFRSETSRQKSTKPKFLFLQQFEQMTNIETNWNIPWRTTAIWCLQQVEIVFNCTDFDQPCWVQRKRKYTLAQLARLGRLGRWVDWVDDRFLPHLHSALPSCSAQYFPL